MLCPLTVGFAQTPIYPIVAFHPIYCLLPLTQYSAINGLRTFGADMRSYSIPFTSALRHDTLASKCCAMAEVPLSSNPWSIEHLVSPHSPIHFPKILPLTTCPTNLLSGILLPTSRLALIPNIADDELQGLKLFRC